MVALKLVEIDNSVVVVIPEEQLERLGVTEGDTLYAVETPEGLCLTTSDPNFEEQWPKHGAS